MKTLLKHVLMKAFVRNAIHFQYFDLYRAFKEVHILFDKFKQKEWKWASPRAGTGLKLQEVLNSSCRYDAKIGTF